MNDADESVDILEYSHIDEKKILEDAINGIKGAKLKLEFEIDRFNDCYFMTDSGKEI